MSPRTVLLLALLVALPGVWVPTASAQGTVDVSVWKIDLAREPVVNDSTFTVTAWVNSTGTALVRVHFLWADETELRPGPTPGTGFLVKDFQTSGSAPVNLTFRPPFERRGAQELIVRTEVQGAVDVDARNDTARRPVFVRHARLNLTWEAPAVNATLPQGETHLRYFVRNDGNHEDNVTPEIQLTRGPWEAYNYGPLPNITPGGSATGIVLVRSTSATDLRNLSLNLSVRSGVGGEGFDRQPAPEIHANESLYARRPTVALEGLAPNVQIFPGEERAIPFTLRNAGDLDQVFRVAPSILGAPAGWNASMRDPPGWQANLTTPANASASYPVALRPGESVTLQVNVTRALDAPNATATLVLEANSTNGDRIAVLVGGSYRATATALLTDAGPDLTVALATVPTAVYQGDLPGFRIEVRNVGRDAAANSTLQVQLRDNLRAVEEASFPLAPLGPGNATLVAWNPATAGLSGTYVLDARILANASQLDRNPDNDTARRSLQIRAPSLAVRAPEVIRVVPGGTLMLSSATGGLAVENLGAHEESVLVTLESSVPWLRSEWRATVPAGGVEPLRLELDVPSLPGVDRASATLRAVIDGQERFSATTTFAVEVDDVDTPQITLLSPATATQVGNATRLAIRATDASGIRRAEVILQTPGGERVNLPLQRDAAETDAYFTTHTPYQPGAYALEFRVEDGSGAIRGGATLNATWTVQGSAYQGLKPVNFGEGAHVGRVPLRFAEAAPGTTRSAVVDAGIGFVPLAPPYEVALPMTEGPRLVVVRATSVDGTVWTGQWNVTVDRTAPTLDNGTTKDAGAGRVDLSVRAQGAKTVLARFQTDTGPVEVPLSARSNGVFGATVNAPGSWDSVTFLAEDDAGNVGSTVVDAPKNETPMAGVGLALLAVALVALLRRRA